MNHILQAFSQSDFWLKTKNYIQLMRVTHWSKSLFILIGPFYYTGSGYWGLAILAALSFCLVSSAVYIYNDIEDKHEDSLHPTKRLRPIACNEISVYEAVFLLFFLLSSGLSLAFFVSNTLLLLVTSYLLINVAYTHILKLIPIMDVMTIAFGFMLRVLAGTIGIGLPISIWLTVVATLLSLYIALSKRRLELQLGLQQSTRKVLQKYCPYQLLWTVRAVALATFFIYTSYVFDMHQSNFFFLLTLPFAAFALWRFELLCLETKDNDDPVHVFLADRLSRMNLLCFLGLTLMALSQ